MEFRKGYKIEIFIAGDCVDSLNNNILCVPSVGGSTIVPAYGYWYDYESEKIEEDSYVIVIVVEDEKTVDQIIRKIPLCVYDQDCVFVVVTEVKTKAIVFKKN